MRRLKDSLPLHVFVRRQQVLDLYRKMHKVAQRLDDKALGVDIRAQIRLEFRHNAQLKDNMALRNLLQDAQRNLAKLQSMEGGQLPNHKGTWQSYDGEEDGDKRGRVGQGFPWTRDASSSS